MLGLDSTGIPNTQRPWIRFGGERQATTPPGAAWALSQVINDNGAVPLYYTTSADSRQQRAAVWHAAIRCAEAACTKLEPGDRQRGR
ncbi:hypothetical protein [Saccharothrix sp. HUAS TT1]|uniref:hypothetical protein n=1 Tax=unclassified Saccharothrix TaxID=2593673 RepID=UPI00345C2AC8